MGIKFRFYPVVVFIFIFIVSMNLNITSAASSKAISKDQARNILIPLMPDVQIISVEKAAVEGLWEVVIKSRGQNGIVYLDGSGKHVVFGSIIESATKTNLTKKKFDEINKVDVSIIPLDDALVMGNNKAKHKVIVFDDPD